MTSSRIHQAVVLATHTTTRGPLALRKVGGLSVIQRTLLNLQRAGIRKVWIITGPQPGRLTATVQNDARLRSLSIEWIRCPRPPADHGLALLRARPHIRGPFFAIDGSHLFDRSMLSYLEQEPLDGATLACTSWDPNAGAAAIAVSTGRQRDRIDHVSSATKAEPGHGQLGHGQLGMFSGVMACDEQLFSAIDVARARGKTQALLGAFTSLAENRQLRVAWCHDSNWQSVATKSGKRRAESMLIQGLRKSVDGYISRWINRYVSLAFTRVLKDTPITPNHVTVFNLLISVAAGVVAAAAGPGNVARLAIAAALWQLASMLDGTDGELARLRFQESRFGEWADTLTDDIGKFVFFSGFGYGVANVTGQPIWLQLSLAAVVMQVAVALGVYRKLIQVGSGSHYALSWATNSDPRDNALVRFYRSIEFMGRRDYFVFAIFCLTMLGLWQLAILGTFITTAIIFVQEMVRPRQARSASGVPQPAALSEYRDHREQVS